MALVFIQLIDKEILCIMDVYLPNKINNNNADMWYNSVIHK